MGPVAGKRLHSYRKNQATFCLTHIVPERLLLRTFPYVVTLTTVMSTSFIIILKDLMRFQDLSKGEHQDSNPDLFTVTPMLFS